MMIAMITIMMITNDDDDGNVDDDDDDDDSVNAQGNDFSRIMTSKCA